MLKNMGKDGMDNFDFDMNKLGINNDLVNKFSDAMEEIYGD